MFRCNYATLRLLRLLWLPDSTDMPQTLGFQHLHVFVCVSDPRLEGMTGGLHAWMNIVRADEVSSAVEAVHANDAVMALYGESIGRSDLRVLEADLTRTFDAFEADFPGANTVENQQQLKRVILCALYETGGGYCQVSRSEDVSRELLIAHPGAC